MATTHDMRYEEQNRGERRVSPWAWIIPLALIILAAIIYSAYATNNQTTTDNGLLNNNTTPSTGVVSQ
jgi:cytochrome oxidase Cu insertion factor (SCO1/SenC/PrrC family)